MITFMKKRLLYAMLLLGIPTYAWAVSVFTTRLDDPKAVYLTAQEFGAHADGKADDSAAIQAAIDKAESSVREGIVFVPAGPLPADAHRLRLAGGARHRLRRHAPRLRAGGRTRRAFRTGVGVMVMFTGARPGDTPRMRQAAFRFRRPAPCRPMTRSPTPIPAPSIRP